MTSFPSRTTAEPSDNGAPPGDGTVKRDVVPAAGEAVEPAELTLAPFDLDAPGSAEEPSNPMAPTAREAAQPSEEPLPSLDLDAVEPAAVPTAPAVPVAPVAAEAPAVVEAMGVTAKPEAVAPGESTAALGTIETSPIVEPPKVVEAPAVVEPIAVVETPAFVETPPAALAPTLVTVPAAEAVPEEPLPTVPLESKSTHRLTSLDALRGFDMLWIIGLDAIAEGLSKLAQAGWLGSVAKPVAFIQNQLNHRPWEGLAFEDLIFPLFVFIVGVSLVFSLTKAMARKSKGQVITRILVRTALLYLFGLMVYNGFDQPIHGFPGQTREGEHAVHAVRWLGVLQRIAICYCAAALLFCFVRPRYLALITVLLLVGYWLLMTFVSVPGVGRGSYAEGYNLANYLDQHYLGGYKWDGFAWDKEGKLRWDPEGYLSTFPAIATCLLGVFAGLLLRGQRLKPYAKFAILLLGGAALAVLGYAWGFRPSPVHMPVIKKLWTSSYVLLAGGYSAMMLALFYLVIDIWRLRGWAAPFVWVGANAITLYMLAELGGFKTVAARLVGGGSHDWPLWGAAQALVTAIVMLTLVIVLARFLYRRGVFIRV